MIRSFIALPRRLPLVFCVILAAALAWVPANGNDGAEVRVTVVQTTDIHGRVLPWDYFREKEQNVGLARVASYVGRVRAEQRHVLLLDNGDLIQGSPLAWYFLRRDTTKPNPMIRVLNTLKYDAFTVGNHEFNFGLPPLLKCRDEASFPFLSANTRRKGSEEPFFKPYIVKEFDGVRIGVLGLTTSNIPNWETPENLGGLVFDPTPDAARKWVRVLREVEKVDAVLINTHEGFEVDLATGRPNGSETENRAWELATAIPGVDAVLTGHSHDNIPPRLVGNVLIAQGHSWGQHVTRLDLVFRKEKGRWVLAEKSGLNPAIDATLPVDPVIAALIEPYDREVREWIAKPIATAEEDLSAEGVFTGDNALLDLIHAMVLERTGAQLSFASYMPGHYIRIARGPVRVSHLFALYPYENTTTVIALKGKYVREALEVSAEIYDALEWDAENKTLNINQQPDFRRYGFNTLAGARYAIDPTRPAGQRVVYLEIGGKPVDPEAEYTLATNSYQAAGAGGRYAMFKNGRVVSRDTQEVRDLLIDYVQKKGALRLEADWNWFLRVPAKLVIPDRPR